MKNILIYFIIIIIPTNLFAHTDHYKNIKEIEMEIFKDNKVIGFSKFTFSKSGKKFEVKNLTKFEVKIFGVKVFSILSRGIEKYIDDQLVSFNSETFQNDKRKFVNLKYDKDNKIFKIDGSSYKGSASIDNIVGNWWNHKILQTESQISPLSGSVKKQVVEFVGKEKINLYNKEIKVEHFTIKSTDQNLDQDKKLNFHVWYDKKRAIIVKISYERLGSWEYRLKSIK